MAAIITNDFRKNSTHLLLESIVNSQNYFLGIGKSDKWPTDDNGYDEESSLYSVPLPQNTIAEKRDAINNLQTLVKVQSTFTLFPRNEWVAGRRYKVYDQTDPNTFNYTIEDAQEMFPSYVTYKGKVYICLENGNGAISTSAIPSDYIDFKDEVNDTYIRSSLGTDGYTWAFVQLNSDTSTDAFYTDSFIPALADLDPVSQIADIQNAKAATGGLIYGFKILNGGSGIIATDTITLVGRDDIDGIKDDVLIADGVTTTPFTVTISGGAITELAITDLITDQETLKLYSQASVIVDGHPEVNIVPMIAPIEGFGYSPKSDLPTWYAGIAANFDGDVETEALTNTTFRQVTLIKQPQRNIKHYNTYAEILALGTGESNTFYVDDSGPAVYTWNGSNFVESVGVTEPDNDNGGADYAPEEAYDALYYMTFDAGAGGLTREYEVGSVITQPSTGAKAFVDGVDMDLGRIYYHQNSSPDVNLKPFDPDETALEILEVGSGTPEAFTIISIIYPEHVHNTGDCLFIENRKRIERDPNQTETVKLVIQF
jgi:hypothetical protein